MVICLVCSDVVAPAGRRMGEQGVVFHKLATTQMACPPSVMDLEHTFFDLLGAVSQHYFDAEGRLVIVGAASKELHAKRSETPLALNS